VATLDDAAEALVVKLRGLDSEIEESEHQLQDCRTRIDTSSHEVDQEWTVLGEAVSAFMAKLHEEQDRLGQETQQALHATADAQQAVSSTAGETHSEIAQARGQLDGLAHHATALQPNLESLASEAGEAPAHALSQRAAQIEQELTQALEEARDFLGNTVAHGLEQLAHDVRERCQAVRTALAEEAAHQLQAAFDQWEAKVGELETYVKTKGFLASHDHAQAYVDYAAGECELYFQEHLDGVRSLVQGAAGQLQELGSQAHAAAASLVEDGGSRLVEQLEPAQAAAEAAVSVLDGVKDALATRSFVRI